MYNVQCTMNLLSGQKLALHLLSFYDLESWSFRFDHAKKRFGCCNFNTRIISLSRHLVELNSEEKVRDTLLHEIAHALVGPRHAHDKVWKAKVKEIGGKPERCVGEDVLIPKGKYTASCPSCGKNFQAQRKRRIACGKCCKQYNCGRYLEKFRIQFVGNS